MKNIILFQFDSKREKNFLSCIDQLQESYEIHSLKKMEELVNFNEKLHSIFYMHSKDLETFENIADQLMGKFPNLPINIIFKKRDFEVLLRAYDYSFIEVLDRNFSPGEIQKALLKCELNQFSRTSTNLPIKNLTSLFSSPIKLKNEESVSHVLSSYFSSFNESVEFSIINISHSTFCHEIGAEFYNESIVDNLRDVELQKFYIGQSFDFGESISAFPIYNSNETYSWLICRFNRDLKDKVFNKYFFRFLENNLIYRKGLDKTKTLKDLSEKDDVTGLYNQRKLNHDLQATIEEHENTGHNFAIMFIDVDHFKRVNDSFGHVIGSKMLVGIGEILGNELRGTDRIYRYGGDEFVVIMPKVDTSLVHKIAVRVQSKVKQNIFNIDDAKNYKLSVSIGIAIYPKDAKSADEIISFADEMMYVSKKSGRGKVFHVGEITDATSSS